MHTNWQITCLFNAPSDQVHCLSTPSNPPFTSGACTSKFELQSMNGLGFLLFTLLVVVSYSRSIKQFHLFYHTTPFFNMVRVKPFLRLMRRHSMHAKLDNNSTNVLNAKLYYSCSFQNFKVTLCSAHLCRRLSGRREVLYLTSTCKQRKTLMDIVQMARMLAAAAGRRTMVRDD